MGFFNFGKKSKLLELQNILFDDISSKLIVSEKELYFTAQKQAQLYMDYIQKSLKIVNTTSLPQLYFENFETLLYFGDKLVELEPYISFSGDSPSKSLEEIKRKEQESIYDFLGRYLENFCNNSNETISPDIRYEWFIEPLRKHYSLINEDNLNYIHNYCKNEIFKIKENKQQNKSSQNVECIQNNCKEDIMEEAIKIVIDTGQASTSMLQRRLQVGYARAGRMIDDMEKLGIVGPYQGSNPRKVLITYEQWIEYTSKKTRSSTDINITNNLNGYEFEQFCCRLLEKNGYTNVTQTKLSGDDGIDVLAEKDGIKYAIQCKCYTGKLGNKAVQEAYTGLKMYNCDIGAVMTNSYFTESAINTAEQTRIRLWDRDILSSMMKSIL